MLNGFHRDLRRDWFIRHATNEEIYIFIQLPAFCQLQTSFVIQPQSINRYTSLIGTISISTCRSSYRLCHSLCRNRNANSRSYEGGHSITRSDYKSDFSYLLITDSVIDYRGVRGWCHIRR